MSTNKSGRSYLIFTIIDSDLIYKIRLKIYDIRIKIHKKQIEKTNDEESKKTYNAKVNKVIILKENYQEKHQILLNNREEKRKNPYKIRYEKNKSIKWLIVIMIIRIL